MYLKKKKSHRADSLCWLCNMDHLSSLPSLNPLVLSQIWRLFLLFLPIPPTINQSTWQLGSNLNIHKKREVAEGEMCWLALSFPLCLCLILRLSKSKGLWDIPFLFSAFAKSPPVLRAWQVAGGDGIIFKVGIPKVEALMKRKPIYCWENIVPSSKANRGH